MTAIGICLTYGREYLCGLLATWQRQTVPIPLLVWCDGIEPDTQLANVDGVTWVRAPRLGPPWSVGPARAAAVAYARTHWRLAPTDAMLPIDDDDAYHPRHVELTLRALERAPGGWTGALRIGLQRAAGEPPDVVESAGGPGVHSTWAMRLSTYDAGGGYPEQRCEDSALAHAIGWQRCKPHPWLTHVRRHHTGNLSRLQSDRELQRRRSYVARALEPRWSDELAMLEQWIEARIEP